MHGHASPTSLRQRYAPARHHAAQFGLERRLRARPTGGWSNVEGATLIDGYTRGCLATEVGASLRSQGVSDAVATHAAVRQARAHSACTTALNLPPPRSCAGCERPQIEPAFIAPGSPWQNGLVGSFNGKLRDEWLDREGFRSRAGAEAEVLIERRRQFYNERRFHSARRYQSPAMVRRARLDSDNIDTRLAT
ncbi:transposase [Burkholderia pseudomallei]|nr:transposase [Burkholderia pseudomallei]